MTNFDFIESEGEFIIVGLCLEPGAIDRNIFKSPEQQRQSQAGVTGDEWQSTGLQHSKASFYNLATFSPCVSGMNHLHLTYHLNLTYLK